ncbi:uncharacterized protein LOC125067912 isoform X2 [Vanessa atalanta]|uniref:uncharacterized protein LOC125067912 isoform X2 n=1 Tax=Vanessa atalanta TaxID=42275 RepID=UPI001FCDAD27|nr:uncharacterized protein LOC125067912 isoform X2 [Vanessa atalanta]
MPDTLSLSAGVSLGLLAGIVSGVCYLLSNGMSRPRDERRETNRSCIRSNDNHICVICGGDQLGGAVPCICQNYQSIKFESGAWFLRQVQRAISLMPWSFSTDRLEQIEEEECEGSSSGETRGDLHNVREFLEAISSRLAGGPLEGTRVSPLYTHPAYLPQQRLGPNAHNHTGASGAHAQLKRLVARVVEEAAALPALARYAAEPHTPTESSTYEDLLATAILNKVIERYQTESGSGGRSSGIHSASASPSPSDRSSPRSLNSRNTRDITPPLRDEDDASDWEEGEATDDAVEVPRRVPFPEYGGDIVHTSDNELRDFDEVSGSDIQAVDGTWEENWLFQKKKIKNIQSAPVPMLVPNSNTQYRALIGDRDADDTTDLSDNGTDNEEELEYTSDIKKVLNSKHVIGGKPKVDEFDFEPDSLMIIDGIEDYDKANENNTNEEPITATNLNLVTQKDKVHENIVYSQDDTHDSILVLGVDSGPITKTEFNLKEEIHRTALNGHDGIFDNDNNSRDTTDSSTTTHTKESTNTLSRSEREKDYEETEALPVQRYADSLRRKHFEEPQQFSTPNIEKEEELIPGSIADRERKKWLNYVEMPNNPYSPEAIKKRLSSKNTSSLFDIITTKKDLEEPNLPDGRLEENVTKTNHEVQEQDSRDEYIQNKMDKRKLNLSISTDDGTNERRSMSPSPKVSKDVLSDEVPQFKRYGRDYYIKEARSSSGERKMGSFNGASSLSSSINKSTSLENFDRDFASPGLLIHQFNTIATNQQYTKFTKDNEHVSITTMPIEYKNEIIIEYEDANEHTLFAAKPGCTDEDTDKKFEEILQCAYSSDKKTFTLTADKEINENEKSPSSIENSLSSSSVEDSIKIYNVQTGEIVKCKPEDKISTRYATTDKNDNIDIPDMNTAGETTEISIEDSDVGEEAVTIDSLKEETEQVVSDLDELAHLPSVKELARKFVSMESLSEPVKTPQPLLKRQRSKENILSPDAKPASKLTYMHSLTARSISKEFREELKLSMATPLKIPGGAKEIPEGTEDITRESSRPGSPVPEPGTIKTKLAFFESLKERFSHK